MAPKIEIAIMIEGQDGLNWANWQRIAHLVEELGFAGLYRSDHFTNASPPDKDSLELWVSLTWLASHTRRIEFGPLVSPVSFRHPAFTARMASAVDDLSGGRLILGVGAGWQEREHNNYGFDLLSVPDRFQRFEEGLEVITRLLHKAGPQDFHGQYYNLNEAVLLPRPQRPNGPPILIGGNGPERTLPLVARFASEWNSLFLPPDEFRKLNSTLDELVLAAGRQPQDVRRSMMTGLEFGQTSSEVEERVQRRTGGQRTAADLRARGALVGTAPEIVEQLHALAEAGVQRVMLQWLDLEGADRLRPLAEGILSHV
jgi:F420-dependent oxidoreductase-like protein